MKGDAVNSRRIHGDKFTVDTTELSFLIRCPGSKIRALRGEGMPVAAKVGSKGGVRFDLRDVFSWLIERERKIASGEADRLDLEQERARQARASAAKTELDISRMKREMVPIELAVDPLRPLLKSIADELNRLPIELKNRQPTLTSTDLEVVRDTIARVANDCADLADRIDLSAG